MSTLVSQVLEELGMSVYVNNFRDERLSVASECHSLSDRELQSWVVNKSAKEFALEIGLAQCLLLLH